MTEPTKHSPLDGMPAQLAARYEALVRDMGILRQLEELDPARVGPDDIGVRLAGAIAREDGAEQCSVMRLDTQRGCLVLRAVGTRYATQGFAVSRDAWHGKEFALGEGIAGIVAATRNYIRIDDTWNDPRFLKIPESPVNIRSLLCYPLLAGDRLLGVLNLSHPAPGFFSPDREHGSWLLARRAGALIGTAEEARAVTSGGTNGSTDPGSSHLLGAEGLHTVGEIAGRVAHDLNRILSDICNTLDAALAQDTLVKAHALVANARSNGAECGAILENLVEFASAVTAPRIAAPVVLADVFQRVKTLLERQPGAYELFTVDIPEGFPLLQGDQARLYQAFVNISKNAMDAIATKSGMNSTRDRWIHLGAELVRRTHTEPGPWGPAVDGMFIRAFVADNGAGMTPEITADAWNPFFTTKNGAVGLGLSAVFQITRQHDGWVETQSTPGRGTTVSLYIPVPDNEPGIRSDHGPPDFATDVQGESVILLVDDEPLVRGVGAAILKRLGHRVVTAKSGADAVKLFKQADITVMLAIVDVNMPGMDGREVLAHFREIDPEFPVILSSGDLEEVAPDTPAHLKPTAFLEKPYLIATMAEIIESALRHAKG